MASLSSHRKSTEIPSGKSTVSGNDLVIHVANISAWIWLVCSTECSLHCAYILPGVVIAFVYPDLCFFQYFHVGCLRTFVRSISCRSWYDHKICHVNRIPSCCFENVSIFGSWMGDYNSGWNCFCHDTDSMALLEVWSWIEKQNKVRDKYIDMKPPFPVSRGKLFVSFRSRVPSEYLDTSLTRLQE